MLRARSYLFLPLLSCVALALAACEGEKPIDETTGAMQEAIPAPGVHLVGTYTNNNHEIGSFSQLVLKTDGTFHAATAVVCFAAPCNDPEQDGRYTLFRRETVTFFELYPLRGDQSLGRYQYALQGDTLSLRKFTPSASWTPMQRSPAAWCATNHDCAVQDLLAGPCAGQYVCADRNICNYQCGAAPEVAREKAAPPTGG